MTKPRTVALLLVALVAGGGCTWPGAQFTPDSGADGTTDGDGDIDGDADADAPEGDADASGDGDVGPLDDRDAPLPYGEHAALCLDGTVQELTGFTDCESLECAERHACCRAVEGSWVQGDFTRCADLDACDWDTFAPSTVDNAVAVDPGGEGWLLLSGDGAGEAGAVSRNGFDLSGEPTVRFLARLGSDEEPCGARCRQAVGVALTLQRAPTPATGVTPFVGMVLDGELGAVHLYAAGRLVRSEERSVETLAAPRHYGFRLRQDGRVDFWVAREGELDTSSFPDHTTAAVVGDLQATTRLALFGRVDGTAAGRIGGVELHRLVCDVPGAFARVAEAPLFLPAGAGLGRAAAPAVIRRPTVDGAPLLMVFETMGDLAVATSEDGLGWEVVASRAFDRQARTDYGLVARRAPALLYWGPEGELPYYNLWFEGESEAEGGATAIVHAVSPDGVEWHEPVDGSIAIPVAPETPWRHHVGQPSVVVRGDGLLTMFFVGRDPETGATALGRATSSDGERWTVEGQPLVLEPSEPADFERDGIGDPTVVVRGSTYHLWYTGLAGSRAVIGYAVGVPDDGALRFERLGAVMEAEEAWEGRRVAAPAVLVSSGWLGEAPGLASVMMWYEAGPEGREGIALAARQTPADPVEIDYGF